jgi:cytidylate kinase
MSATSFFSYINHQPPAAAYPTWSKPEEVRRTVTLSRQAGCGAQEIAGKLAARLQAHSSHAGCPWTIFDRALMDKVLVDPRLPKYLDTYLPPDLKPAMEAILEGLFGPNTTDRLARQKAETMLGLAEVGNAIIIGGGGNIVAAKVPHALHVRLIAPLDQRLRRAHEIYGMPPPEARQFCLAQDLSREEYVRAHFNSDVKDPMHYHLVINTALMSYDAVARLIEDSLMSLGDLPKSGETWATRDSEGAPVTGHLTV